MADVKLLAEIALAQGYRGDDLFVRLIRAATTGGAAAMGLAEGAGYDALAPGGPADLALFEIDVADNNVERALVQQGEGNCVLTISGGVTIHELREQQLGRPLMDRRAADKESSSSR